MGCALSGCSSPDGDLPPAYRDLDVPRERLASSAQQSAGRALYLRHCALCHGAAADGRGARSSSLSGPPANFTDPNWQKRFTARRLYWRIREGVAGTSMPAWKGTLSADETWVLVAYLRSLGPERSSSGG